MKKIILFIVFLCISSILYSQAAKDIPSSYSNGTFEDDILRVIYKAQEAAGDYDGNGRVNCVDRAIAFYCTWLQFYNHRPYKKVYKCEIVDNTNKNVYYKGKPFSHLFVRVKYGDYPWIYVEPSYNPAWNKSYRMEDVWGDVYDPAYNTYGVTRYWVSKYFAIKYNHWWER